MNWCPVILSVGITMIAMSLFFWVIVAISNNQESELEEFSSIYSNPRSTKRYVNLRTYNGLVKDVQGDPYLASLYKKYYFLEGTARENIAQNRDGPGSGNGVPRERIALENTHRLQNRIKHRIEDKIAKKSKHTVPTKPPVYSSNPMLGLPSVPGVIPTNAFKNFRG